MPLLLVLELLAAAGVSDSSGGVPPVATGAADAPHREADNIRFSAAAMLAAFCAAVATGDGFGPADTSSPEAVAAAAAAIEADTVDALLECPAAAAAARCGSGGLRSALDILVEELATIARPPDGRTDTEAVRLLLLGQPSESSSSSPSSSHRCLPCLSAGSRGLLAFVALWLAVKFWARSRASLSLNRILFDLMERRGRSPFGGADAPVDVTDALAGPPPDDCNDRCSNGVAGSAAAVTNGCGTPLGASLADDVLTLQPSQWSAPRGGPGGGGGGGAGIATAMSDHDAIGYILQGVEETEIVLLRCCGYVVPLPQPAISGNSGRLSMLV